MTAIRRFGAALAVPVALLALASCSSDDDTSTTDTTEAETSGSETTEAAESGIEIEGAWARTSPAMADAGAAYLTITSATDDLLIGASVPDTVAGKVELHETVAADEAEQGGEEMPGETATSMGDMAPGSTEGTMAEGSEGMGEMTMVPVSEIELPAGEAVSLEPGGLHIMLLDLVEPLAAGDEIELTLTFETADPVTVKVPVRDDAPESE